jgi:hypothetical protein
MKNLSQCHIIPVIHFTWTELRPPLRGAGNCEQAYTPECLYMGVLGILRVIEFRMRWVGRVQRMEGRQFLTGWRWENQKERAYFDKSVRRWEYNIKMNLKEISQKGLNWIYLAQYTNWWRAVINTVVTLWLDKTGRILTGWGPCNFSRGTRVGATSMCMFLDVVFNLIRVR